MFVLVPVSISILANSFKLTMPKMEAKTDESLLCFIFLLILWQIMTL